MSARYFEPLEQSAGITAAAVIGGKHFKRYRFVKAAKQQFISFQINLNFLNFCFQGVLNSYCNKII